MQMLYNALAFPVKIEGNTDFVCTKLHYIRAQKKTHASKTDY